MAEPRTIAVFDFDHTLITGESFWHFLGFAVGWPRTVAALAEAVTLWRIYRWRNKEEPNFSVSSHPRKRVSRLFLNGLTENGMPAFAGMTAERQPHPSKIHSDLPAEFRTFIKAHLLKRLLAGRSQQQLAPAIEKLRHWRVWNEPVKKALLDHHAQGHHIVVASGGLDLYLHELLKDLPHDAVICTTVDIATGAMTSGNCVRRHKAEMVAEYMASHGPFGNSWGYGNLPHDLPMLELMKNRIVI